MTYTQTHQTVSTCRLDERDSRTVGPCTEHIAYMVVLASGVWRYARFCAESPGCGTSTRTCRYRAST
eukprot:1039932-Rhodomonas_salina.2